MAGAEPGELELGLESSAIQPPQKACTSKSVDRTGRCGRTDRRKWQEEPVGRPRPATMLRGAEEEEGNLAEPFV